MSTPSLKQKFSTLTVAAQLSLCEAAHELRAVGFNVVACDSHGKAPIDYDLQTYEPLVAPMSRWDDAPTLNIGLCTGKDFWVLDVDGEAGRRSFSWLRKVLYSGHGSRDWVDTFTVKTARGLHYYFRMSALDLYGNSASVPTSVGILPGIDVRGYRGLIIVPPSVHATGISYSIENATTPDFAPIDLQTLVSNAKQIVAHPRPNDIQPTGGMLRRIHEALVGAPTAVVDNISSPTKHI